MAAPGRPSVPGARWASQGRAAGRPVALPADTGHVPPAPHPAEQPPPRAAGPPWSQPGDPGRRQDAPWPRRPPSRWAGRR